MHAVDCKYAFGRPLILTLKDMLIVSAGAGSCLDSVSSQAVQLVDGDVGLHVGELWWRDHLEQCAMTLKWSLRQNVHVPRQTKIGHKLLSLSSVRASLYAWQ